MQDIKPYSRWATAAEDEPERKVYLTKCLVSVDPAIKPGLRPLLTTNAGNQHLKWSFKKKNLYPVSWLLWGGEHKSVGWRTPQSPLWELDWASCLPRRTVWKAEAPLPVDTASSYNSWLQISRRCSELRRGAPKQPSVSPAWYDWYKECIVFKFSD